MNAISGVWRLLAWRRVADDGSLTYPLGEVVDGLLVYTPQGSMAVQMASASRPNIDSTDPLGGDATERAAAYSSCLAYFGTYEVRGNEVIHTISVSLYPNWSGTNAARPFEIIGDQLTLRTLPSPDGGETVVNEMYWARVSGGDGTVDIARPATQSANGDKHE
jgi:hypothetical protein